MLGWGTHVRESHDRFPAVHDYTGDFSFSTFVCVIVVIFYVIKNQIMHTPRYGYTRDCVFVITCVCISALYNSLHWPH